MLGIFEGPVIGLNARLEMNGGDDGEANLEIAKLHLARKEGTRKARSFLTRVCKSKNVTEAAVEEARNLLKKLSKY